jgi:hypothetical protein
VNAEQCDSVYALADGVFLRCSDRYGHTGIHLAPVEINGVHCETGRRDSEAVNPHEAVSTHSERTA